MQRATALAWLVIFVGACCRLPVLFERMGNPTEEPFPSRLREGTQKACASGAPCSFIPGLTKTVSVAFANKSDIFVATSAAVLFVDSDGSVYRKGCAATSPCPERWGRFRLPMNGRQLVMLQYGLGLDAYPTYENEIDPWITRNIAGKTAARTLAVSDSITIPVALIVFGVVVQSYRLVALPILSSVITSIVSMASLSFVSNGIPSHAVNIQSALALALAVDYSMFLVHSTRGFHTVAVSGSILLASSLVTLSFPSVSIHIIGVASSIAISVSLLVNLTLIRFFRPSKQEHDDDDDDDDELLTDNPETRPFVAQHPGKVASVSAVVVIISITMYQKVQFCGGVYCGGAKSPTLSALEALPIDPQPLSILLPPNASFSHYEACAGETLQRIYLLGSKTFMDVATPLVQSSGYTKQVKALERCLGPDAYVLNKAWAEMDLMLRMLDVVPRISVISLSIVFVVMAVVYRAPVIALKAVVTVASTFVTASAALGLIVGWEVCWMVPVITMPLVVGVGMDFHVFYLDGIKTQTVDGILAASDSTRRITNGAGVILAVAFVGLLAAPIRVIQQMAIFLIVAVILDTGVVRTLVVPSAMILLGRYNWVTLTSK